MLKISKILAVVTAAALIAASALISAPAHAQSSGPGAARSLVTSVARSSPGSDQTTYTYVIRADIDGHSRLTLRSSSARWINIENAAPGRHNGKNNPTIINGTKWFPQWPEPGENRNCDCHSNAFWRVTPAIPAAADGFFFHAVTCRDTCSARYANGVLCINFNDDPTGSDAWYQVKVVLTVDDVPRGS
jgi:hypothetical protein